MYLILTDAENHFKRTVNFDLVKTWEETTEWTRNTWTSKLKAGNPPVTRLNFLDGDFIVVDERKDWIDRKMGVVQHSV